MQTINRRRIIAASLGVLLLAAPVLAGDAPPECSGPTCKGACAAVDPTETARWAELVERQRDELVDLTRTLAGEQKRQAELEAQLTAARADKEQAAPAPSEPALEVENRRLRQMLDIEREENQKLAAKLRTASRVADLVFRSAAADAAAEQVRPAVPAPRPGPQAAPADHQGSAPAWPRPESD